jgi:dTDP-4-dehydrorhamnose reductase
MINILVNGSNGQLGNEIRVLQPEFTSYNFHFTDVAELDITNKQAILDFVSGKDIHCIINAAAYTAVDKAESEPEKANLINGTATGNLAEVAKNIGALLVHISTDYIFDGKNHRPLCEDDPPGPVSAYAHSKWLGEVRINEVACKAVTLRTSWLYSEFGVNFVKSMIKYGREREVLNVVFDQIGSPTYAADLASTILQLIPEWLKMISSEVFHYSNEGVTSWYDFTLAIHEIAGIKCRVNPIETKDYPLPATRPFYSVLTKEKIKKKYSIQIPYWRDSLKICIGKIDKPQKT